jgi:hypothetical protein
MLLRCAFAPRIALRALPQPTLVVGQYWMPIPGQCSMLIDTVKDKLRQSHLFLALRVMASDSPQQVKRDVERFSTGFSSPQESSRSHSTMDGRPALIVSISDEHNFGRRPFII